MGLLAFDDTDSVRGGCTTHVALEFLRRCPGVDLVGLPRLVRLNPNVPWKTRGNGSVVLPLGHGRGRRRVAGRDGEAPIHAFEGGDPLSSREAEDAFGAARRLIHETARLEDPKTHPGLAYFDAAPDASFYWRAVRTVVDAGEAQMHLAAGRARHQGWKSGRGLIGATAGAAWPHEHGTYEWISYRAPAAWGTQRLLDPGVGPQLDAGFPSTFDNYDARRNHLRIEPRSPCPVLAGIRGTDPQELVRAARCLGPERAEGGLLFATNQATDDHIQDRSAAELRPFEGARVGGRIDAAPRITPGGHVFARLGDGDGVVTLAAYEPTKEFRRAVRALRAGDAVEAVGSTHADARVLALEKLRVLETVPRTRTQPPLCGRCGVRMKSRGRRSSYRCKSCHARARRETAEARPVAAEDVRGAHEVPVLVRRHLARPLRFSLPPAMGWC